MKINKYFPIAFVYFFVNAAALPIGLTYTAILSPILYWYTLKSGREILLPFFICLSPFVIVHFLQTVDTRSYLVSMTSYITVYIFCQAFYIFLHKCKRPEEIFRKLLLINFLLCLVAIPLYFSSFNPLVWMENELTDGTGSFKRLKLFTYEASYYAVLFTPLFFFYFVQLVLRQNKVNSWWLLLMLLLPYILSFSMGVIAAVMFACLFTYILFYQRLTRKKRVRNILTLTAVLSVLVIGLLWLLFPENILFARLGDIVSGNDTSGNGRTSDAFILAKQILEQGSAAFGIGAGQIKILGADIIREYYLYPLGYNGIAIPNAAAETLAIFGWAGLLLRIGTEVVLFFYTKVWTNYYRLLLFLFILLYQFTGSFITSIAEYVIWILAFKNVFPAFDVCATTRPARAKTSYQMQ